MFACAPTSTGKTLAFIVSILAHMKVLTIIILLNKIQYHSTFSQNSFDVLEISDVPIH